jgi:hypothetical protein
MNSRALAAALRTVGALPGLVRLSRAGFLTIYSSPGLDVREEAMSAGNQAAWRSARTLADLGELTARWLEGDISQHPCYGDGPDEETGPLIPVLAQLNRAGLLTTYSSPGLAGRGHDGAWWQQRAAVEGFIAGTATARAFVAAARRAGMDVVVHHPDFRPRWRWRCGEEIPVTLRDGDEYTWFGQQLSRRDIRARRLGWGICHRDARDAVCSAWQVTVVDPVWGRADELWPVLSRAVPGSRRTAAA